MYFFVDFFRIQGVYPLSPHCIAFAQGTVLEIWKLMQVCVMHCLHHYCFRYIPHCSYLCILRYISPILLFPYNISSLCSLLHLIYLPLELAEAKQNITFCLFHQCTSLTSTQMDPILLVGAVDNTPAQEGLIEAAIS